MNVVSQGEINLVDNKINLAVLIFPFKTLDYIVCEIPRVSNVLAGTLITIPNNVTGTAIPLSPKAIGERGPRQHEENAGTSF
jgi:hypothetical protein